MRFRSHCWAKRLRDRLPFRAALLTCTLALLAAGAFAQLSSDPPSPAPPIGRGHKEPEAAKSDTKPAANQRGSEELPLIVKSLEPEKSAAARDQEKAERDEKAANERSLVVWTLVLAVLTGVLALVAGGQLYMFWRQLGLMESSVEDASALAKAAKASADAATVSSDALMVAQRAYVSLQIPNISATETELFTQFEIVNCGNTPANKMTIAARLHVRDVEWAETHTLPDHGAFRNINATLFPRNPQKAGEKIEIAPGVLEAIRGQTKWFYVIGSIRYEDIFRETQTSRFFFRVHLQAEKNYIETMPVHNEAT